MNKKIMIAVLAVLVIVIGAVVAFLMLGRGEPKEKPIVYYEYAIETQYANIKAVDESSKPLILKYSCAIQYTDGALEELIAKKLNELKNEYRKYFMSKNSQQLNRVERVQEDLVEITSSILGTEPDVVTDVFFTDFIMQ